MTLVLRVEDIWSIKSASKIIEKTKNINTIFLNGFTLLEMAARENQIEVTKWLLENGADPEVYNENLSSMRLATINGNVEISKLLKKYGAKVIWSENKSIVLKETIQYSSLSENKEKIKKSIEFLIDNGILISKSAIEEPLEQSNHAIILEVLFNLFEEKKEVFTKDADITIRAKRIEMIF
jgi:ankyrin repeat protein